MKAALVFFGLLALGSSAPQPRKLFHEHLDDFMEIIINEVADQLAELQTQYMDNEEFQNTIEFITNANFKDLVFEMESLPEFKTVIDFLERDNIDILYFIDLINSVLETTTVSRARQSVSGSDMSSFINDAIALFPKDKLAALYDELMTEDKEFKTAMENLQSEEWQQLLDALFENETFQKEVQVLHENGIDINILVTEIKAVFGQN